MLPFTWSVPDSVQQLLDELDELRAEQADVEMRVVNVRHAQQTRRGWRSGHGLESMSLFVPGWRELGSVSDAQTSTSDTAAAATSSTGSGTGSSERVLTPRSSLAAAEASISASSSSSSSSSSVPSLAHSPSMARYFRRQLRRMGRATPRDIASSDNDYLNGIDPLAAHNALDARHRARLIRARRRRDAAMQRQDMRRRRRRHRRGSAEAAAAALPLDEFELQQEEEIAPYLKQLREFEAREKQLLLQLQRVDIPLLPVSLLHDHRCEGPGSGGVGTGEGSKLARVDEHMELLVCLLLDIESQQRRIRGVRHQLHGAYAELQNALHHVLQVRGSLTASGIPQPRPPSPDTRDQSTCTATASTTTSTTASTTASSGTNTTGAVAAVPEPIDLADFSRPPRRGVSSAVSSEAVPRASVRTYTSFDDVDLFTSLPSAITTLVESLAGRAVNSRMSIRARQTSGNETTTTTTTTNSNTNTSESSSSSIGNSNNNGSVGAIGVQRRGSAAMRRHQRLRHSLDRRVSLMHAHLTLQSMDAAYPALAASASSSSASSLHVRPPTRGYWW